MHTPGRKKVVIVGAGGNIGSHLCVLIARIPAVRSIVLIDRERYEAENLTSQEISPWDVGRSKAAVQAERLARLRPRLSLLAFCEPVESVPWGELKADIILSCPDSLSARLHVNEVAWRLGVPWVDAGVQADGWMARVSAYLPEEDSACLECSLSPEDHELAAAVEPCFGDRPPPPSQSAACLGALAASLQAIECHKVLSGSHSPIWGRQALIEAAYHHHYLTTFRRNPHCSFDHQTWDLRPVRFLFGRDTLQDLAWKLGVEAGQSRIVRVAGQDLITALVCTRCGSQRDLECLELRTPAEVWKCRACHGTMAAPMPHRKSGLPLGRADSTLRNSLAELGFRSGDVLTVESVEGNFHYRMIDPSRSPAPAGRAEREGENDRP